MLRDEAEIAGNARSTDHEQRRQLAQDPGRERLGLSRHPVRTVSAGEQVLVVPPDAHVHVTAIADLSRNNARGETGAQPVVVPDGADGLADEHAVVGCTYRVTGGHGHLELAGRVLGMNLLHGDGLCREGGEHVAQVVRAVDQSGHAVGRARGGRDEGVAAAGIERPLQLERHLRRQALLCGEVHHPGGEASMTEGVDGARPGPSVDRRPRPTRLGGQLDEASEVGVEAEVAHRAGR